MNKHQNKVNLPICMAAVLLCLTLLTTSMVSGFYARYSVTASGSDSARTATFAFKADGAEKVLKLEDEIKKPGDFYEFDFTVSNDNGTSEVDQSYTVLIKELGSLPLTYTLESGEKNAEDNGSTLLSDSGELHAGDVNGKKTYTLKVEWLNTEANKNPKYAGGVAALSIRITSSQTD